ncbi:Reticulon-domain-containing protein [Dactylonectria macrodidyma]|uniref:Reticulon-like protein n=1 Tax=Dactylonectria macrodidyma TaxID=307937 RepID=A0A9P9FN80_9HYPO|nr:Reticulon-domain-containing protein [Dactylonectria macrodidyma]
MADTAPAVNGNSLFETTKSIFPVSTPIEIFSINTPTNSACLDAAAAYNTVTNGPVAQNVMEHTQKTSDELSNLAAARRTPANPAATGQPLTHYHSFFSELLSWNNPRASALAYVTIIALIFSARYLDILRWGFKLSWMVLGVTVLAEVVGKTVLNHGLATHIRPRRYYTVPRDTLDTLIGDVHELINFFVIEAQRILFAENIAASCAAWVAAFVSYFLVKLVPYWGLAVIGTTVVFLVPLVYASNQELIDAQIQNASDMINSQTAQVKDVAQKQIGQVSALGKQYAGDYTGKVQALLSGKTPSRQVIVRPEPVAETEFPNPPTEEPTKAEKVDFPEVPKEDPVAEKQPFAAA